MDPPRKIALKYLTFLVPLTNSPLPPTIRPSTSRNLEREMEAESSQPSVEPQDSISMVGLPPSQVNDVKEENGHDAGDGQLLPDVPEVAGALVKKEDSLSQASTRSSEVVEYVPSQQFANKTFQYTTKKQCS